MADVHFAFVRPNKTGVSTYGGQPRGETESGGGTTTLTLQNGEIVRAKAITGASYVRLGGTGSATAANGFYLAQGDMIDLYGSAGDQARQDDA